MPATIEGSRVPAAGPLYECVLADVRTGLADGDPLTAKARRILERSFGVDLSAIRIHADPSADRLTRLLNTDAFAAGPHLFFRLGAYQPQTRAGLGLLTREVAHALQQAQTAAFQSRNAHDMEREADEVAQDALAGQRRHDLFRSTRLVDAFADGPLTIQRQESFEHRALGDVPGASIGLIASRDRFREGYRGRNKAHVTLAPES